MSVVPLTWIPFLTILTPRGHKNASTAGIASENRSILFWSNVLDCCPCAELTCTLRLTVLELALFLREQGPGMQQLVETDSVDHLVAPMLAHQPALLVPDRRGRAGVPAGSRWSQVGWLSALQQGMQGLHLRHRRLAGEIAANVGCGLPVHQSSILKKRDSLRPGSRHSRGHYLEGLASVRGWLPVSCSLFLSGGPARRSDRTTAHSE